MEFKNIKMEGPFIAEKNILHTWSAADEKRILYDENGYLLYFGTNAEWQEMRAFESGTKVYFYNASAPTGWTITIANADCVLATETDAIKASGTNSVTASSYVLTDSGGANLGNLGVSEGDIVENITDSLTATVIRTSFTGFSGVILDTDIFPAGTSGKEYRIASSYREAGGTLAGTWTMPFHVLMKNEIPRHQHTYEIYSGKDTYATQDHGWWRDQVNVTSEDGTLNGLGGGDPGSSYNTWPVPYGGSATQHNHGSGHRPYAAVGIVAEKD